MPLAARIVKQPGKSFRLEVAFATGPGLLGILGPSGSGKSMILKCLAGVEEPDAGRISLDGAVLFDREGRINKPPQQRRVGYLFQNYALFPNLSIEENIAIATGKRLREVRPEIDQLLARFRLHGLEKRYPKQLSGGQQQRAALARLLASRPAAILLDEPFSALDPHLREHMQLELRETLRASGVQNVIMVTHSRDDAYRLCSSLAVLDNGRILRQGDTREVFRDPRYLAVAQVTGCKNISRLEKLADYTFRARDWGLVLASCRPIPDCATHVGIRAHALRPVWGEAAPAALNSSNIVKVRPCGKSEDLFEWNLLFRSADAPAAAELPPGEIWWKYGKGLFEETPERLYFPPDELMFLAEVLSGAD